MPSILEHTDPQVIISGHQVADVVQTPDHQSFYQTIYLPEHAHIPVGHAWDLTKVDLDELILSIKCIARSPGFAPFTTLLRSQREFLGPWLEAVKAHPDIFALPLTPWSHLAPHLPQLETGVAPPTLLNEPRLAPIMDLRSIYVWRIVLDKLLTGCDKEDVQVIHTYLQRVEACISRSQSYVHTVLPATLHPHILFHFPLVGTLRTDYFSALTTDVAVPSIAKAFAQIEVDTAEGSAFPSASLTLEASRDTLAPAPAPASALNFGRPAGPPLPTPPAHPHPPSRTTLSDQSYPRESNLRPSQYTIRSLQHPAPRVGFQVDSPEVDYLGTRGPPSHRSLPQRPSESVPGYPPPYTSVLPGAARPPPTGPTHPGPNPFGTPHSGSSAPLSANRGPDPFANSTSTSVATSCPPHHQQYQQPTAPGMYPGSVAAINTATTRASIYSPSQPAAASAPPNWPQSATPRTMFQSPQSASSYTYSSPLPTTPAIKWSEAAAWSIASQEERTKCHPLFLVNSFLLAMELEPQLSPHCDHFGNPIVLPASHEDRQFLMARETCQFFVQNVQAAVYSTSAPDTAIVVPARSYLQSMLQAAGHSQFNQVYSSRFFRRANLKALLDTASWDMSPGHSPTKFDDSIFTTYDFISCLKEFEDLQGYLPTNGLTILQAQHLAQFVNHWFRSMDIKAKLQNSNFRVSVLGQRLEQWGILPNDATIHGLWLQDACTMTYRWMESLRALLEPFQQMISSARWKDGHGFVHIRDRIRLDCTLPPSNALLLDRLARVDHDHAIIWQSGSYDIVTFRPSEVPRHHFRAAFKASVSGANQTKQDSNPRGGTPVSKRYEIVGRFKKANTPGKPMFKIKDKHGNPQLICVGSAFGSPFNCCSTANCTYRPKDDRGRPDSDQPRQRYLHVDLSDSYWASLQQDDWSEVIQYLQTPKARESILPSPDLKALLPNVQW